MDVRAQPGVLWREGMFLCPQHMQAFGREIQGRIGQSEALGLPGAYGLLRLRVDEEALARDVFSILEATLVFRDGTLADFPRTAVVEQREFADQFTAPELDVHLGVSAALPNVPQIGEAADERARYDVRTDPVFDENLRDSVKDLEFRHVRGRLFFGEEDRTGFDCLPIARLVRRGKPVARSVLSSAYVPPVAAIGASPVLMRQLKELADLLRGQARDLSTRIPATAGLSSVEKGADIAGFVKLQAVNQCVVSFDQLAGLPDLHPFDAYRWMGQAVGNLAVFGEGRVVPELPVYDHARQDECFGAVIAALRTLVVAEVTVPYDTVPFRKDPVREGFYEVEFPQEWIDRQPLVYLAVEIGKPAESVIGAVATGLKLVAPSDIERVLQGVVPGIALAFERVPPLAFPKRPELHFFRVQTEGASREPWLHVLKARMAILLSTLSSLGDVRFHLYVELRS